MESAKALDRDYFTCPQTIDCGLDWAPRFDWVALRVPEFELRTAFPACVRLCVKTAVARVIVFGAAFPAHRKNRHRSSRPVVGDIAHDREARPAIRAVDEGIEIPAIGGIEQLTQTIGARGYIR